MIRRALLGISLLALPACMPPSACAESGDMVQGIEVHVSGITGPARTGRVQNLTVNYKAAHDCVIKRFTYGMRAASTTSDATPDSVVLLGGQVYTTHVTLTPGTPDETFTLEVTVNGHKQVFFRDMSQLNWDRTHRFMEMQRDPVQPVAPPAGPSPAPMWNPGPGTALLEDTSAYGRPLVSLAEARRRAGPQATAGTFRVYGTMRYERPAPLNPNGIDGATYYVYQITSGGDIPIGSGTTTWDGTYDITVPALAGQGTHLYMTVLSDNHFVHVRNNSDHDNAYKWKTKDFYATLNGNTGYSFYCSQNHLSAAFNLLTVGVRMFRWVFTTTHFNENDIDDVDISYPESNWPHYTWPVLETLYIPNTSWAWNDGTILHELGHHAEWELPMDITNTDYDDGVCDNPNGDPGHCQWCAEQDEDVTYMEGFPTYFADAIQRHWEATYGQEPSMPREVETLPSQNCNGGGCSCDPYFTEGYFSTLLRDFEDDENESDPRAMVNILPEGTAPQDVISLGGANILYLLCDYSITTTTELISALNSRYAGNFGPVAMWNTLANAGFQRDVTAPGLVPNVHSTSHQVSHPSPNTDLVLAWDAATDNYSGVGRYVVYFQKNGLPAGIFKTTDLVLTIPDLTPGSYTAKVTCADNAGNFDGTAGVTAAGPWIVRDPYPSDLAAWAHTGWTYSFLPRGLAGASVNNCVLPATLPGNRDSTYFNWAIHNAGEVVVDTTWWTKCLVDGVVMDSAFTIPILGNANTQVVLNHGKTTIRGGRHTMELRIDARGAVAESNETNNRVGKQFVWSPLALGWNTIVTRPAPPNPTGGWGSFSVPIGHFKWKNCDGLAYSHTRARPTTTSTWMAVEAHVVSGASLDRNARDCDLYLHYNDFDGSEGGFTADGIASSTRGPGYLDALITNSTNSLTDTWDVGVVNTGGSSADYKVRATSSTPSFVGDSTDLTVPADQLLVLRDLTVTAANAGRITVEIRSVAGGTPIRLAWYASGFSQGSLDNATAAGITDSSGAMKVTLSCGAGLHALAIYRDPSSGTGAWRATLKIYREPTDVAARKATGWYASMTPRPTNDGTVLSVPAPLSLWGDDHSTWFNLSYSNLSGQSTGSLQAKVMLDNQTLYTTVFGSIPGNSTVSYPNRFSSVVPGGRHVGILSLDPSHLTPELDEMNNTFGEQWVWMPDTLAPNTVQWRKGQIGGQTAGWDFCDPNEVLGFDCDGVRLPPFTAASGVNWTAVAVTSRDSGDVDLMLHDMTSQPNAGFDTPLEDSNWGRGSTDLIVTNFINGFRKLYDVGIYRISPDTSSYVVNFVTGISRDPNAAQVGPFTMAADRLVDIHEFQLPVGQHRFHLRNLVGTVDWSLAAYNSQRAFQDRTAGQDLGWSIAGGPGGDEEITFPVTAAGSIAIAVYKNGTADRGLSGQYRLEHNVVSTSVEGAPAPARTALQAARPTPFRSSTTLAFDLAQAAPVSLGIYDVSGKRVREVLSQSLPAGRHTANWDGMGERGARLSNGVYLVRLRAGSYTGTVKVVRVN